MSGSSLKQEVLGFKMAQGHGAGGREPACQRRLDVRDTGSIPDGEDPIEEEMVPTPVLLPGKSCEREPGGLQSVGLPRVGHD